MYSTFYPKLRSAYRSFIYSVSFSIMGLLVEIIVFLVWSSIILLTDIIHWIIDCVVEVFALITMYYAIRVGKKFPWSILVFESVVMLFSITIAFSLYVISFINYITVQYIEGSVTTTSILSIIGTITGGVFTLIVFIIQRRNYSRYKLEVLRIDYFHALIDLFSSILSTIGIVIVYYTRSSGMEMFFVFTSMVFIIHSLFELMKDVVKTITGTNIDYWFSMKLFKKLVENYSDVNIEKVIARKIGSFYAVEVKLNVDPHMKILSVHKLRSRIIRDIHKESDLVYHVDVKIYPLFKRNKRTKH